MSHSPTKLKLAIPLFQNHAQVGIDRMFTSRGNRSGVRVHCFLMLFTYMKKPHPSDQIVCFPSEKKRGGSVWRVPSVTGCEKWGFPRIGVPQKWRFFDGKSHLEMDELGLPPFWETSKWASFQHPAGQVTQGFFSRCPQVKGPRIPSVSDTKLVDHGQNGVFKDINSLNLGGKRLDKA